MGGQLNIQDFNQLMRGLDQSQMDHFVTLNRSDELELIKELPNAEPPAAKKKVSTGGFFGLFGGRKVTVKPASENLPMAVRQSFGRVRTNLTSVVGLKLSNYVDTVSSAREYNNAIYEKLIGNKGLTVSDKPLTARQIKEVLDETAMIAVKASSETFNIQKADLVNEVGKARAQLHNLGKSVDDDTKKKIDEIFARFDQKLVLVKEAIKNDTCMEALDAYTTVYTEFLSDAKDVQQTVAKQKEEALKQLKKQEEERIKRLADEAKVKAYHEQMGKSAAAFDEDAETIMRQVKGELLAKYGENDAYISKNEIDEALKKLEEASTAARKDVEKDAENVTAETADANGIVKRFKEKLDKLKEHAHALLKDFEDVWKTRCDTHMKFERQRQVFVAQCNDQLAALKEKCDFEFSEGFDLLWKESFGDTNVEGRRDEATNRLKELWAGIDDAAQQLFDKAQKAITAPEGESDTPQKQKERFTKALEELSRELNGKYTKLCQDEDSLINAEKETRQAEREKQIKNIVQNYRSQIADIVKEFNDVSAKKLEGVSPNTTAGKELQELCKKTNARLTDLTQESKEAETPEAARKRLEDVINLVNDTYKALAEKKHAEKAEIFTATLNAKVDAFKVNAQKAVATFKETWANAFPAKEGRLGQAGLDRTHDAVVQRLTKMSAAFVEAAWVEFDKGTKELPEDIDHLFAKELNKIVLEGQNRLEQAQYLEMLREHNGQKFDDAASGLMDLAYRLGDVVVTWKFPDARADRAESVLQERLHKKFNDISTFLNDTYTKLGQEDDVSPYALSVAAQQIDAFVAKFNKAIAAANGNPENLLARIGKIALPEIVFKSVDDDLADEAFFQADAAMLGVEGNAAIAEEVKNALVELKTAMKDKYEVVKGLKDPSARYAFQQVAREAFGGVVKAVKEAAAHAIVLSKADVATFARPEWEKITRKYTQLINSSCQADIEQAAARARTQLEMALAQAPKKFGKGLISRRATVYGQALTAFDAHVDALRNKLSILTDKSQTFAKDTLAAVLNDLSQKVAAFIAGADTKGNYNTKENRVPPALTFASLDALLLDTQEEWKTGIVGTYETFDEFKTAIENIQANAPDVSLESSNKWNALLASELKNVENVNSLRIKNAKWLALPEEPKPVKGNVTVEEKRQNMATQLAAKGKDIEAQIAKLGLEQYEKDLKEQQARAQKFKDDEVRRIAQEKEAEQLERAKQEAEAREKLAKEAEERRKAEKLQNFRKDSTDQLNACEEKLRKSFSSLFLNCSGMDRYRLKDEYGNHAGWNDEGMAIINAAVATRMEEEWKNLELLVDSPNPYGTLGMISDAEAQKLLNAAREELERTSGGGVVGEEDKPYYPVGQNAFGIDAKQLDKAQYAGLMCLVRSYMLEPSSKTLDPVAYAKMYGSYPTDEKVERTLLDDDVPPLGKIRPAVIERALAKGLDLSKMTTGYANLLVVSELLIETYKEGGFTPEVNTGLWIEDVYELDKMYARLGVTPKLVESLSMTDAQDLIGYLGLLRLINNRKLDGIEEMCQRVFGVDVSAFVACVLKKDEKDALMKRISTVFSTATCIFPGSQFMPPPSWRADYDPLARTADNEKKAVAILEHRHAFGAGDKSDVEAFYKALTDVRAAKVGQRVEVTIANTPIVLTKTDERHVSAMVSLAEATITRDEDGDVVSLTHNHAKRKMVPVAVPVPIDALVDRLDETILTHAETYGTDKTLTLLNAKIAAAGEGALVSSRTRQLCVGVLRSYAGLTSDKVCFASTKQLVDLTRLILSDTKYAKLSVAARAKEIASQKLLEGVSDSLLNTSATLELYRKYQERCKNDPADVQRKVVVPEPAKVQKDETPEQARTRRIHEFAADLIQLHDTTKFDLARAGNKSDVELMRDVLLAHRAEVEELLKDESNQLLDSFTFSVGQGEKLNAFTVSLRNLITGLRGLYDNQDYETLFLRIADPKDTTVEKLLTTARASFDKNATAVLKNLQSIFKNELARSFAKNAGPKGEDLWRMSLSELTGTATIDPSKGYGAFLQNVIGQYFTEMSDVDRNRMAAQVMRFSTNESTKGQLLGSLLKGAGPILQKFMQGLPQSSLPDILWEAVTDLKSNLAPIPEEAVRAYLLDVVDESHGYIQNITVKKSLGAASVGQAFLCVVKTVDHPEGEECVIKVLRPDAQSRAHREENFFRKMAGDADVLAMLEDRFARIYEELDLTVEADNVARGGVYDPEGRLAGDATVRSMKLHPAANSTSNVMFLRRAPGETYDRLLARMRSQRKALEAQLDVETGSDGVRRLRANDLYDTINTQTQLVKMYLELAQRQQDLCHFVTRWTEEVAFQGGFFHGDVHAGNIMADVLGLTVIDFGNATQLTEAQRKDIMFMLVHTSFKQTNEFMSCVGRLLPASSQAAFAQLKKKDGGKIYNELRTIFEKGGAADVGKRFIAALQHLQNSGVELPGSLFNLMECMRRLDESINAINQEMAEIKKSIMAIEGIDKPLDPKSGYWFDETFAEYLNRYLQQKPPVPINSNEIANKLKRPEYAAQLKEKIKASCGTRKGYEDMMVDVRRMMKRSHLSRAIDFESTFAELLARAERNPALFNPADPTYASAQDKFAEKLAAQLVEMQWKLLSNYSTHAADIITEIAPPSSFADAVGVAVNNNVDRLKADIGFVTGAGLALAKRSIEKAEGAYDARLKTVVSWVKNKYKTTLSQSELAFLRKQGERYNVPVGFADMLASGGWAKKAENRRRAFEVFRNALTRMRKAMVGSNLKERQIGKESSLIVFARVMAAFFMAQYEESGFEKLGEKELATLVQEAGEDVELQAFLREVHTLANLPTKKK